MKLFNLKDKNIIFSDIISERRIKDLTYTVLHGILTYTPDHCPCCGCVNTGSIIKHGSKSSQIKLLPVAGNPTLLKLRKQRFLCKDCGHTFSAETDLVNRHCYISNQIKQKIFTQLELKVSEKDIASMNNVSHSTVSKIIDNCFESFIPDHDSLPANLMFDEFKSTRDARGAMSFIFCDSDTHRIVDIVENRQLYHLRSYFSRYTKRARYSVRSICMDFYSPYISLVKELFPKARIIVDRFHLVQLLTRALLRTRISCMKNYSPWTMEYKRLKRYWRLIQMDNNDLDGIHFHHYIHFHGFNSSRSVVEQIVSMNPELRATYDTYQLLLKDIHSNDHRLLLEHCRKHLSKVSDPMRTSLDTILEYSDYVTNALSSGYSNGAIEGTNNYIKVLKRVAFGYKSFVHFRNRILISRNLMKPKKRYQML